MRTDFFDIEKHARTYEDESFIIEDHCPLFLQAILARQEGLVFPRAHLADQHSAVELG